MIPPPSAPTPPPPPPPNAASVPPRKSHKLPWILGGCGCLTLLLLAFLAAGVTFYKYKAANANSARSVVSAAAHRQAAVTTATNSASTWKTYSSAAESSRPDIKDHFVAFSFRYPPTFIQKPNANGIFVQLDKMAPNGTDVAESFTVTWYEANNPNNNDGSEAILADLGKQWENWMPQYLCRKVESQMRKIGGVFGAAWLWEFSVRDAQHTFVSGERSHLVHPAGTKNGVRIDQYGTWLDPKDKVAADVGEHDDLGDILATFKFQ